MPTDKRISVRAGELHGVFPKVHEAVFCATVESSIGGDQGSAEALLNYSALVAISDQLAAIGRTLDYLVKLQRDAAEPATKPAEPDTKPAVPTTKPGTPATKAPADPSPVGRYGPRVVPFDGRCG